MIHFPSTVTVTATLSDQWCGTSCVDFCGCHQYTQQVINGFENKFVFGIIPDISSGGCASGCGTDTWLNNTYSTASHELAESITDPYVDGWLPNGEEIGDACLQQNGSVTSRTGTTYVVQTLYDRVSNACVDTNAPRYCQQIANAFGIRAGVSWGIAPSESWRRPDLVEIQRLQCHIANGLLHSRHVSENKRNIWDAARQFQLGSFLGTNMVDFERM